MPLCVVIRFGRIQCHENLSHCFFEWSDKFDVGTDVLVQSRKRAVYDTSLYGSDRPVVVHSSVVIRFHRGHEDLL